MKKLPPCGTVSESPSSSSSFGFRGATIFGRDVYQETAKRFLQQEMPLEELLPWVKAAAGITVFIYSGKPRFEMPVHCLEAGVLRDQFLVSFDFCWDQNCEDLLRQIEGSKISKRTGFDPNKCSAGDFQVALNSASSHQDGNQLRKSLALLPSPAFLILSQTDGERCCVELSGCFHSSGLANQIILTFEHILQQLLLSPKVLLSELSICPPPFASLSDRTSDRRLPELKSMNLYEVFQEHVAHSPNRVAVESDGQRFSYSHLHKRALIIASQLNQLGIGRGQYVALISQPGVEFIAAVLGIVHRGAVYVPLDPDFPTQRLRSVLGQISPSVILLDSSLGERHQEVTSGYLTCSISQGSVSVEISAAPVSVTETAPLYVLFTSGTTASPKGVVIPHGAVLNLTKNSDFNIKPGDRFLQLSNVAFDASTFEMWGALLNGGSLHVIPRSILLDQLKFNEVLQSWRFQYAFFTSAFYNRCIDCQLDALGQIDFLIIGGEPLSCKHVRQGIERFPETTLVNGYGPTENTTFSTYHFIEYPPEQAVAISLGRPLRGSLILIVDEHNRLVPFSAAGEILVGGSGLALSYLGKEIETEERFFDITLKGEKGTIRLYRTGDLGRLHISGDLEYLGRKDRQIKIRGHRVEAAEIEAIAQESGEVSTCVTLCREMDSGHRYLAAFCVLKPEGSLARLKEVWNAHLPGYAVPETIHAVDSLPLTPNGKLDLDALHRIDESSERKGESEAQSYAHSSDIENRVAGIWSSALRMSLIDRDTNFFDAGGDSLLMMEVHSQLSSEFRINLPITTLYQHPTIATLSDWIKQQIL